MNNRNFILGFLLIILALTAALYFWYAPQKPQPVPVVPVPIGFIEQADKWIREGKLADAKGWLVSQNFEGKEDAPRLLRLALLEFNERPAAAQALLGVALDTDPHNVAFYLEAASKLEKEQRVRLAQEVYQKAIALEPDNPKLYDALAEFYLKNNLQDLAFLTWEKALALPHGKELLPKVNFYAAVVKGSEDYQATRPLEAKWLRVLQALADAHYDQAENLIKNGPEQLLRPDLEESILLALNYRKSRVLPTPSFLPQTPLQKELFTKAKLKHLLKSPEIFTALLLDSGWDSAALRLNRYETLPEKYPTWLATQLVHATQRVKGVEAAYLFALNQSPTPEMNRLVAELERLKSHVEGP